MARRVSLKSLKTAETMDSGMKEEEDIAMRNDYRIKSFLTLPEARKMVTLDDEMTNILNRTDLPIGEKVRMFDLALARFRANREKVVEKGITMAPNMANFAQQLVELLQASLGDQMKSRESDLIPKVDSVPNPEKILHSTPIGITNDQKPNHHNLTGMSSLGSPGPGFVTANTNDMANGHPHADFSPNDMLNAGPNSSVAAEIAAAVSPKLSASASANPTPIVNTPQRRIYHMREIEPVKLYLEKKAGFDFRKDGGVNLNPKTGIRTNSSRLSKKQVDNVMRFLNSPNNASKSPDRTSRVFINNVYDALTKNPELLDQAINTFPYFQKVHEQKMGGGFSKVRPKVKWACL